MGLSLAQIRNEVLEECGIDAVDLDAAGSDNLDLIINQSWWEIMDKFDFREKQDDAIISTVVGQRDYNLASTILAADAVAFEALRGVFLLDPDTNEHQPLDEISIRKYETLYNEDEESRDEPTNYVRDGGIIRLWPTPDDVYDITLYFLKTLSDVAAGGPDVPQAWHEIIKYGAIWRTHHRFRDYTSAKEVRDTQLALIASAQTNVGKEDKYKGQIGVSVPTREFGRRY